LGIYDFIESFVVFQASWLNKAQTSGSDWSKFASRKPFGLRRVRVKQGFPTGKGSNSCPRWPRRKARGRGAGKNTLRLITCPSNHVMRPPMRVQVLQINYSPLT